MAQQNHGPPSPGLQKLRVDRLRKEEEEDQWISGEELYTEGSSDDEVGGEQRRQQRRGGGKKKPPPSDTPAAAAAARRKQRRRPEAPSGVRASPGSEAVQLQPPGRRTSALGDSDDEEEEVEISWRPKRGSVKLPELSGEGGWLEYSSVGGGGGGGSEVPPRGAMDKIREMDALLFVVEAKRKESEAKTEQSQLRIREVLKELCAGASASRQSKVLARKFIRLCNKAADDTQVGSEVLAEADLDKTRGPSFTVKMKGTKRSQASSRASNTTRSRRKKKKKKTDCARLKFLLRNVQLAADGKGTLAVTAEEKVRLASLLRGRRPTPEEKFLVLEPGAAQLLQEIDSKLKEFSAEPGGGSSREEEGGETMENYALRLEEIEAGLSRLNQATTQVVSPLEEGELRGLLEACRPRHESSSCPTPTPSGCSSGDSLQPHPATPAEALLEVPATTEDHLLLDGFGELVAEARRLMPFFKFKY